MINDDQIYDPLDDSVEADYEDDGLLMPSTKTILRRILRRGPQASVIIIQEPEKLEPGLYYLNYAEDRTNEGRHWISSRELYDPANKFALLNAGTNSWGLKMFPDKFKTGFEEHYLRYGGVGTVDFDSDDDEALVYLVRFHNQAALDQFKLTSFFIPLHIFAPLPVSPLKEDVFTDTNEAQLAGWRNKFKGSGFTDREIMGIVNTHHDYDRMEMLFLNDFETLNKVYRYLGGKHEKGWMLRNLRKDEE